MPSRLTFGLGVFLLAAAPTVAQTTDIEHRAGGCAVADKFPRLDARFTPNDNVATARIVFQPEGSEQWWAVAMKAEGTSFFCVLPKPKKSLKAFRYYAVYTLGLLRQPQRRRCLRNGERRRNWPI